MQFYFPIFPLTNAKHVGFGEHIQRFCKNGGNGMFYSAGFISFKGQNADRFVIQNDDFPVIQHLVAYPILIFMKVHEFLCLVRIKVDHHGCTFSKTFISEHNNNAIVKGWREEKDLAVSIDLVINSVGENFGVHQSFHHRSDFDFNDYSVKLMIQFYIILYPFEVLNKTQKNLFIEITTVFPLILRLSQEEHRYDEILR